MKNQLLVLNVAEAIRVIISELLTGTRGTLGDFGEREKREALHDVRVSARRLSVWLKVCKNHDILKLSKGLRKDLKRLRAITNSVRDLEVHLAIIEQQLGRRPTSEVSMTKLKKKWEREVSAGYAEIMHDVPQIVKRADRRLSELIAEMDVERPNRKFPFPDFIAPILVTYASQLDDSLASIQSVDDHEKSHRARLAAKALRYLLEPFVLEVTGGVLLLQELRRLQDLLGGIRDCQMLSERLEKILAKSSLEHEEKQALTDALNRNKKEILYLYGELHANFLGDHAKNFNLLATNLFPSRTPST